MYLPLGRLGGLSHGYYVISWKCVERRLRLDPNAIIVVL